MKCVLLFSLASVLLACCNTYKILAILPIVGPSHFLPFERMVHNLALKGHEVTFMGPLTPRETPNLHHEKVYIPGGYKEILTFDNLTTFGGDSFLKKTFMIMGFGFLTVPTCETLLFSKEVINFAEKEQQFDIVMVEAFHTNCFMPFARKFNAHLVLYTSSMMLPWYYHSVGQPNNPSYIPGSMSALATPLHFWDRVSNTVVNLFHKFYFDNVLSAHGYKHAKKFFGDDLPPFDDILQNASLYLINTHPTLQGPKPNVPQLIEIGGIHIEKPHPLPQNIEKWINESEHGVIYFSMGSMIKGHTFPEEKRKIFLRAFGRLKQRVLWKWENDTMPGKPDNVMIQKWMPQFDILCHPNVKAFISHGGLLGTTEAVHCGVPVVVMPQFGDQHTNAKALEAGNGGVILNFRDADEEAVYKALKAVLDPEFNKKAKELSARFRDRPMSPMDTAIYWIEYVARHKGAHHMRTAAVGMPLYQYLLLDVFAFLALIVIVTFVVFFYTLKFFLCFLKSLFASPKKVKKN